MARNRDEADSGASSKRQRTHTKGTIVRLKMRNFMSYADAELFADPSKLNCIIGPNGTGKSSIVCAMCVGLGGPIKVTDRGDQIGGCVHDNADENGAKAQSGFVETELFEGSGPGRNLVVRLEFSRDNKEVWTMDGVAATRKKVRERMAQLNIQVDNPLQFLPQDKVGAFANMSPVDLLKETERAIGPEVCEKHERLILENKALKEARQSKSLEEKGLGDLEKQNEVLYADVERWKRYQANMKELAQLEGKKLWLSFLEERAIYITKNDEHKEKKRRKKEAEAEKKKIEERLAPLRGLVAGAKLHQKKAFEEVKKREQDVDSALTVLEGCEGESTVAKFDLQKVDTRLRKMQEARDNLKQKLEEARAEMAVEHEKHRTEFGRSPIDALNEFKAACRTAEAELFARQDDLQNSHDLQPARERVANANRHLGELDDRVAQKRNIVMRLSQNAVELARFCEQEGLGEDRVLGPILMHLEIKDKTHQVLAEQALQSRTLMSFLARDGAARDALNERARGGRLNVSVYLNKGSDFAPRAGRPDSKDLKRFGVTVWLDEALEVKDGKGDAGPRGEVLGFLSQQMSIDTFLLGTAKTVQMIDELQRHLAGLQFDSVTVLTPERTYKFGRSRYGARAATSSSNIPKKVEGNFKVSVDTEAKARLESELAKAEDEFNRKVAVREAVEHDVAALQHKFDEATRKARAIGEASKRLHVVETRVRQCEVKWKAAAHAADGFNADEQKAEYRMRLIAAHNKALEQLGAMTAAVGCLTDSLACSSGARLAAGAAEAQVAERESSTEELDEDIQQLTADFEAARKEAMIAANAAAAVMKQALEKAPELQPSDENNTRAPAMDAVWDGLPSEQQELDDKIAELEAETSTNVGDESTAESSVRQYQARKKDIETMRERVARSSAAVEEQGGKVSALEAEWKPALLDMITVVDRKFAECFARLRCQGQVKLSDGRKQDEDGQPYGEDDYEQYKIHILVKWRDGERLHVLGEAGRDSGGERSVATMIYLISLQDINPAPFRVVDEINQAMDSTNERAVFTCITEACRDGGKQCFLLTPKLLPDLDYGEDCAIQLVFNGPYMKNHAGFNLAAFC